MTLKPSSKNPFSVLSYALYLVKRHSWIFVVFGLAGILSGPLVFGVILRDSIRRAVLDPASHPNLVQELLRLYENAAMPPLYIWAIAMGFVLAIVMGAYLHSRKQVDFYHALPIRRQEYFSAQLLASFITFFVLAVIMLLMIIVVSMVFMAALPLGTIVYWFIIHLLQMSLVFLASYMLTAIAGQLTGSVVSHGAMAVVLQLGLFVGTAFTIVMLSNKLDTFVAMHPLTLSGRIFEHSTFLMTAMTFGHGGWGRHQGVLESTPFFSITSYLIISLIIVLGYFLNQYLYNKRPLERAGQTLIYNGERYVLKAYFIYLAVFTGAIFVGMILDMESLVSTFIVGMIMAAFAHVVMEMFFNRDVRSFTRGILSSLLIFLAVFGIYTAIDKDVFHYDAYVPQADEVKQINWSFGDMPEIELKDPALIDIALQINETLVKSDQEQKDIGEEEESAKFEGIPIMGDGKNIYWQSNQDYTNSEYYLKKRLPRVRHNYGSLDTLPEETLKKLYENKTFNQKLYKDLYAEDPQLAELTIVTLDAERLSPQDEKKAAYDMLYVETGKKVSAEKLQDAKTLVDALQKDLTARSYQDAQKAPEYEIHYILKDDSERFQQIYIYDTDQHVQKVIDDWVASGKLIRHDDALAQSEWTKELYYGSVDKSGEHLVVGEKITDPEEAIRLLKMTRPEHAASGDPFYKVKKEKFLVHRIKYQDYANWEIRYFSQDAQV